MALMRNIEIDIIQRDTCELSYFNKLIPRKTIH